MKINNLFNGFVYVWMKDTTQIQETSSNVLYTS